MKNNKRNTTQPNHLLLTSGYLTLSVMLGLSAPVMADSPSLSENTTSKTDDKNTNSQTQQDRAFELTYQEELAPISVFGSRYDFGQTVLNQGLLNILPSASGTITDTLRGESSVQFDSASRSGTQGGEITPPKVSIRGARHYENNFMINGVSNNNRMNPGGYNSTQAFGTQPVGDSQSLFIDTDLLDSVTLQSENISAAYGDFTGGVVDAKLRDARADRWHAMGKLRHTRNQWAQQHFTEDEQSALDRANSANPGNLQPRFKRYDYTLSVDGPLSDSAGLMFSYNRKESTIPLYVLYENYSGVKNREADQTRLNETYLVRFNTVGNERFKGSVTAIYSPYTSSLFTGSNKDTNYDIDGGGKNIILDGETKLSFGLLKNSLSLQRNELSRHTDSNTFYQWRFVRGGQANWSANGTLANEGTYGDYEQTNNVIELKNSLKLNPFGPESFLNTVHIGGDFTYNEFLAKQEGYTLYSQAVLNANAVGDRNNGVLAGEQYTRRKLVQEGGKRNTYTSSAAFFVEDTIDIQRVTVRPGVRMSYDNITDNLDVAPRFFANYDLFGDESVNVYSGYNRYYGSQIMAYAMTFPTEYKIYSRTSSTGPWVPSSTTSLAGNGLGELETPYSDEISGGIKINAYDSLFRIEGVQRQHRKQIRSESNSNSDSLYRTVYNNSGTTDYWGLTLGVERSVDLGNAGKHTGNLSATRSMTRSNSTDYNSSFSADTATSSRSSSYVEYNGQLIKFQDMPANNFNNPWVVSYTHTASFWQDRLRLGSIVRYEQGGKGIALVSNNGQIAPDGLATKVYKQKNIKDGVNIDLSVDFDVIKHKDHTLTLNLEVLNLADRINPYDVGTSNSSNTASYQMGRQFYAGIKADW